ncbi:MAG: aminotransferase class III-fold pyridoxal phosphate-dependent enzyme, partial [Thermoleophilum sp.]|nr:aminotransferase class III-fold pyridoxal phosphate-dependent enzyme [Thermoleophilum sp.]
GKGLQTGLPDEWQTDLAELLLARTGDERVRFKTAGSLATMYAIMLARAFTKRKLVMKVGGGWHGAQPCALKGISFHVDDGLGFQAVESNGVPVAVTDKVIVTSFNRPDHLWDSFRQFGVQLACFILEPFLGASGFTPATREYLQLARQLTEHYGAVLILDEVISGLVLLLVGGRSLERRRSASRGVRAVQVSRVAVERAR